VTLIFEFNIDRQCKVEPGRLVQTEAFTYAHTSIDCRTSTNKVVDLKFGKIVFVTF